MLEKWGKKLVSAVKHFWFVKYGFSAIFCTKNHVKSPWVSRIFLQKNRFLKFFSILEEIVVRTSLRWGQSAQTFYSPFLLIWGFLKTEPTEFAISFILRAEHDLNHFRQCFVKILRVWESQSWKLLFLKDSVNSVNVG